MRESMRWLVAVLLSALAGCRSAQSEQRCFALPSSEDAGVAAAIFVGGQISVESLRRRLAALTPAQRARFETPEQRRRWVEDLAETEVLANEGVRLGLHRDDAVLDVAKKALAVAALRVLVDEQTPEPTEAELRAAYDARRAEFSQPEMIQAFDLFLAAPKDKPAVVAEKRRLAEKLYDSFRNAPPADFRVFADAVAAHSDDLATKPLSGNMRFVPVEELRATYGAPAVDALLKLQVLGALSPPVQTETGFYVFKLVKHEAARTVAFEQAAPQLRTQLLERRRAQRRDAVLSELKAKASVRVDDAVLGAVRLSE